MATFTRGGKPAVVAPPPDGREERLLDAVRFWAAEWLWFEHRRERLRHEIDALDSWLLTNTADGPTHWRRAVRARRVFRMIPVEHTRMLIVSDKVHALMNRQDRDLQGRLSQAWFKAISTRRVPARRPTRYPQDFPTPGRTEEI